MDHETRIQSLERQIAAFEAKLFELRAELQRTIESKDQAEKAKSQNPKLTRAFDGGISQSRIDEISTVPFPSQGQAQDPGQAPPWSKRKWPLKKEEYKRYGRQLIMPEIGLQGQLQLKRSKVLIVGVGGLGCPAAAYLAGAGVGTLGLVDGDEVEESNLHRQILHSTERVGVGKVESAIEGLKALNPLVGFVPHRMRLTAADAIEVVKEYDVVLDCTDAPANRYLISDVCVVLGKPLVSASALKTEGQLFVLNNPPRPPGLAGGPCYRCIFPKPPPAESVVSCSEGGILGPVVGVMGVLQALEAIKVITANVAEVSGNDMHIDGGTSSPNPPSMLLFSAYSSPQFRSVKLRSRKVNCAACSAQSCINSDVIKSGLFDYIQFCGTLAPVNELSPSDRMSPAQLAKKLHYDSASLEETPIIIDTRDKTQFDLAHIDGSYNIPFSDFSAHESGPIMLGELHALLMAAPHRMICTVCRLGNDSQIAAKKLQVIGLSNSGRRWIGDLKGGLRAWREEVDVDFPDY